MSSPTAPTRHRILVVDDAPSNLEMMGHVLETLGFEVCVAVSGQDALDVLPITRPDLVLMDIQMPVMDGLTATRLIRQNPEWQHLPIVALTGDTAAENRQACQQAGMSGFLAKPLQLDELQAVLAGLLKLN